MRSQQTQENNSQKTKSITRYWNGLFAQWMHKKKMKNKRGGEIKQVAMQTQNNESA
jgi:hypothetical protein